MESTAAFARGGGLPLDRDVEGSGTAMFRQRNKENPPCAARKILIQES
jgi:hypothetical protein